MKDHVNLLETVSRINVAFLSRFSTRDYFLSDLLIFFMIVFFYLSVFFLFFTVARRRKSERTWLGRPEGLAFAKEVERDDEDSFEDTRPPGENSL